MVVSSIGKQIAPGVYEDLSKKTTPQNTGYNVDQSQAMYGSGLQTQPNQPATNYDEINKKYKLTVSIDKPKVATKSQPVISRDTPKLPTETADVTAIKNMGFDELSDYITKIQVYGIDTTNKDEMYKYAIAQQRIQQLGMPQAPQIGTTGGYTTSSVSSIGKQIGTTPDGKPIYEDVSQKDEEKRREEQARRDLEYQLYQTKTQNISDYERFLNEQYRTREGELQKSAEKEMGAAQNVLSFSGFGRSTFAAEKMSEIQGVYNAQKNLLLQENQIALSKYKAEQEGASAETLAAYDSQISALKQKEAEYLAETAKQVNEYNAQYAQTLQEKLDNIMQTSAIYDETKLTEEQLALADTYAQFLVGEDGNINDVLLKQIPAQLVGASLKRAVKVRQDMMAQGQGFSFQKVGDNTLARINDKTGEVEFLVGPEADSVVNNLPSGTPIPQSDRSQVIDANTDLSTIPELVQKAAVKREASVKNNNPSGVTWGFSPKLRQAFIDAGVNFGQGSQRPTGEGGSYVKFATVGDGLNAHYIVLSQTGWNDVYDRLYAWSAGGNKNTPQPTKLANKRKYAETILAQAGIKKGTKFNELTQEQVDRLVKAHITRESPVFAGAVFGGEKVDQNKQSILSTVKSGAGFYTPSQFEAYRKQAVEGGWYDELEKAMQGGVSEGARKLRKEFLADTAVKNFEKVATEYAKVIDLVEKGTGVSDLATVFNFMKTLDPTSVVREGEFANAAKTSGILDRLGGEQQREKASKGVILTDKQRAEFARVMQELYNKQKMFYQQRRNDYATLARNAGLDPTEVVLSDPSQLVGGDIVRYTPNTNYRPGTIIEKDGIKYLVGNDGNFYEQ